MKNRLFSKDFWKKKKVITAAAIVGVAVVAIAVAVPVALTAQTSKIAGTGSEPGSTNEQIQVISKDMSADADYTQDVPYGTAISELQKLAPAVTGYGPGKLNEQKTTYKDTADAGTEGIVAVYSYAPLSEQESKKSRLDLKVGIAVQKAYVEKYEYTVPETMELVGLVNEWKTYDVSQIKIPKGLNLDKDSVEYYVTGVNKQFYFDVQVPGAESGTPLTFRYPVKADNNHYGSEGSLMVNYVYRQRYYTHPGFKILPLLVFKKGQLQDYQFDYPEVPGYRKIGFQNFSRTPPGEANRIEYSYSPISTNYTKMSSESKVIRPYAVYENNVEEVLTQLSYNLSMSYGVPLSVESPKKVENYEEWQPPIFTLTKFVESKANNYDPAYASFDAKIDEKDIPKLPVNTELSIVYTTKHSQNQSQLKLSIKVTIIENRISLQNKYEIKLIKKPFAGNLSLTISKKPDELLGSDATFDTSSPSWTVSQEGTGEIGIFTKGYKFKNEKEIFFLPPNSIVGSNFYASKVSDNFIDSKLTDDVYAAFKVEEPQTEQKLSVNYNQEVADITSLAESAFPTPSDRKAPELLTEYTTYKKGFVPGQISYVAYKYDSTTPGTDPLYKIYQVEIQKQTIADYSQATVEKRPLESGAVPKEPNEQELSLPEGWKVDSPNTKYYLGTDTTEANQISAEQVRSLTNKQKFTALHKLVADPVRYENKETSYKIEYTVSPPSPSKIIFMPQEAAFADQTNKSWTAKTAPTAPDGWWYVRAHYLGTFGYDKPTPFGPDSDQAKLKKDIETANSETLEIIWTYVNKDGKWLWIVTPYGMSTDLDSYYKFNNVNKAGPVTGTKITFFDKITGLTTSGTNAEAINPDPNDKSYLIDKPAGTTLMIAYKTFENNSVKRGLDVQKTLINGNNTVGRFKIITYGSQFTPTPTRSAPDGFGTKTEKKNEYASAYLQITGQTNAKPGIYVPGLIETDLSKIPGLVKNLPSGTTFTINWSAQETSENYLASSKQYLIDTYVVVD